MKTAIVFVIAMAFTFSPLLSKAAEQPPPMPVQEQPEVLTRGPIHEAFAEPVDLQNQEGLVAPTQPPRDISENPPDERPSGQQFVWVPGYWAWDSERNSYIWVSGCWRAAPPKMYWVPGYWAQAGRGWEWVSGFWAPVSKVQQIEYLPPPPTIEDVEPPGGAPPSPGNIWVPPCWYWHQGQYVLRPGYWVVAQQDWVWVPSHYTRAPRGYIFVAGHWDYILDRRGVLFAPVFFPGPFYSRPGFTYSLSVAVDLGMLQFSMFTYPRYSHFYFGDYYDDVYVGIGIFPRFECRRRHTWYDPIYEHDRWRHRRSHPGWEENMRREYDRRRVHTDLRPPRTYREMHDRQLRMPEAERRSIQMVEPLRTVVADRRSTLKFEQIKTAGRQNLSRKAADVRKFSEERRGWESASTVPKSARPSMERQRPMTPSAGQREPAKPLIEKSSPTKPSTEQRGKMGPARQPLTEQRDQQRTSPPSEFRGTVKPYEKRSPAVSPQREGNITAPERVKIPKPPIADRGGALSIFRKGPPSRPADEQKTDVRSSPRSRNGNRDEETYPNR